MRIDSFVRADLARNRSRRQADASRISTGVKLRRVAYGGKTYYALVSGVDTARSVRCPFSGKVRDTVSGETYTGTSEITLPPYALKAFVSER